MQHKKPNQYNDTIMKGNSTRPFRSKKPIVFSFYLLATVLCGFTVVSAQEPVLSADVMPLFEGAEATEFAKWVKMRCVYPAEALSENIEGKVNFSFVVDKKGNVTDVFIIDSPHQSLSWEVRDIVGGSPKWTPGRNGKKKVPVIFYMHIDFELKEHSVHTDSNYEPAQFEGGFLPEFRNWIIGKIRYPEEAYEQRIGGTVRARFVIEKDGTLTNIIIDKSSHQSLSKEVERVLKRSPKWTPATVNGEPVRLRYSLPVEFMIEGTTSSIPERKANQPKIIGPIR